MSVARTPRGSRSSGARSSSERPQNIFETMPPTRDVGAGFEAVVAVAG